MTGAEISAAIAAIAAEYGVRNDHWPDSRRATAAGWPDHFLMGMHGFMAREVKGDGDNLSADQKVVRYLMTANGIDWDVWTKTDLASGRIRTEIERIA